MPQGSILCFNETVTILCCAHGYVLSLLEYAPWRRGSAEGAGCRICVIGGLHVGRLMRLYSRASLARREMYALRLSRSTSL